MFFPRTFPRINLSMYMVKPSFSQKSFQSALVIKFPSQECDLLQSKRKIRTLGLDSPFHHKEKHLATSKYHRFPKNKESHKFSHQQQEISLFLHIHISQPPKSPVHTIHNFLVLSVLFPKLPQQLRSNSLE